MPSTSPRVGTQVPLTVGVYAMPFPPNFHHFQASLGSHISHVCPLFTTKVQNFSFFFTNILANSYLYLLKCCKYKIYTQFMY